MRRPKISPLVSFRRYWLLPVEERPISTKKDLTLTVTLETPRCRRTDFSVLTWVSCW